MIITINFIINVIIVHCIKFTIIVEAINMMEISTLRDTVMSEEEIIIKMLIKLKIKVRIIITKDLK